MVLATRAPLRARDIISVRARARAGAHGFHSVRGRAGRGYHSPGKRRIVPKWRPQLVWRALKTRHFQTILHLFFGFQLGLQPVFRMPRKDNCCFSFRQSLSLGLDAGPSAPGSNPPGTGHNRQQGFRRIGGDGSSKPVGRRAFAIGCRKGTARGDAGSETGQRTGRVEIGARKRTREWSQVEAAQHGAPRDHSRTVTSNAPFPAIPGVCRGLSLVA